MKTIEMLGTAIVMLGLVVAGPATAKDKIGFISMIRVFEGTIEGKSILDRLQGEHTNKQKELDKKMKGFEEKARQFQSQSSMLKEEVRNQRIQELALEERQLKELLMNYQGALNQKRTAALGKFEEKVMDLVRSIAGKEGLDYILREEVLLHGPRKMDLTNQVIREYDKLYPVKSGKKGK